MRSHDPRRSDRQFRRASPASRGLHASLSRAARRAIVLIFLAFVAVGSYYAWTGPDRPTAAERAPLEIAQASEAADVNPSLPGLPAPEASRADAPSALAAIETVSLEPAAAEVTPALEGAEPSAAAIEAVEVIEILPPRSALFVESQEDAVPPEVVDPASPTVGGGRSGAAARRHRVQSGETLSRIAERYLGRPSAWPRIVEANPGLDPDRLAVGMEIVIPSSEAPTAEAPTAAPEAAPTPASPASAGARVHVVEEGETLSSIAATLFGDASQWRRLFEANRGTIGADPGALRVGMRLVVPTAE